MLFYFILWCHKGHWDLRKLSCHNPSRHFVSALWVCICLYKKTSDLAGCKHRAKFAAFCRSQKVLFKEKKKYLFFLSRIMTLSAKTWNITIAPHTQWLSSFPLFVRIYVFWFSNLCLHGEQDFFLPCSPHLYICAYLHSKNSPDALFQIC